MRQDSGMPMSSPAADVPDDLVEVRGTELRYLLVVVLSDAGAPLSLAEIGRRVTLRGFAVSGRPGKAISDALRWEVRRGRARRLTRGTYGPGKVAKQTRWRMRQRLRERALRDKTRPPAAGRAGATIRSPCPDERARADGHPDRLSLRAATHTTPTDDDPPMATPATDRSR